jgi:hypothetical protein
MYRTELILAIPPSIGLFVCVYSIRFLLCDPTNAVHVILERVGVLGLIFPVVIRSPKGKFF